MYFFAILLTLLLNLTTISGSFLSSCEQPLIFYMQLGALCKNSGGEKVFSSVKLGPCMGNANGHLQWQPNGNAHRSCDWCDAPNIDGKRMGCVCKNNHQEDHYTEIWLEDGVWNDNGQLRCRS